MQLETKLTVRFLPDPGEEVTPESTIAMNALNVQAEAIADFLQPTLQTLVIKMIALKREDPNA